MKRILRVFKRDMKSMIKNPVAVIIVVGICFIPSLYAWINIKACWNPYENTSTVPVAIVNNDKGGEINGKPINIGNEVVDQLKDNHKIGWKFVNSKKGNMGVADGSYYAMIEIPENFSECLTSVLKNNPQKPEIIYKVNTKENAVAGKITEVAEDTLVDQITSNFIDTVNEKAFSSLNGFGNNMSENKDELLKLKTSIIDLNKNMGVVKSALENISLGSKNLNTYLNEIKKTLPEVNKGITTIEGNSKNTKDLIKNTNDSLNMAFKNLKFNLEEAKVDINKVSTQAKQIEGKISSTNLYEANMIISQMSMQIDSTNNAIASVVQFLESINKTKPNKDIKNLIDNLKNIQSQLNNQKHNLINLEKSVVETNSINKEVISSIESNINAISSKMDSVVDNFDKNIMPILDGIGQNLIKATDESTIILGDSKGLTSQIETLVNSASDGSKLSEDTSNYLLRQLNEFSGIIGSLSEKLEKVSDSDLSRIITILQENPKLMGNFIANPFNLKVEPIYSVPNYGSGMAPIYSVLALWVGGLVLTSILRTNTVDFEGSEDLTIREKYLGKMITFVVLAVIQGLIVSLGDKFLLGVYTVNAPLMIAFAVVSSFSFCVIIYTMVSLFGNVGKAINIILMVLQIAGSGGTYPIQVDPMFFRVLQPFFPFTYSIGGFREAIAGPLLSSVVLDFLALFAFAAVFMLLGYFLKGPLNDKVERFEERFKESGMSE